MRGKINELGVEVESTLDDVKRLFNLPYQMQERPRLFFGGGCVALGMLVGRANRSENPFKASATVTKDTVIDTIISICDEELQQLTCIPHTRPTAEAHNAESIAEKLILVLNVTLLREAAQK